MAAQKGSSKKDRQAAAASTSAPSDGPAPDDAAAAAELERAAAEAESKPDESATPESNPTLEENPASLPPLPPPPPPEPSPRERARALLLDVPEQAARKITVPTLDEVLNAGYGRLAAESIVEERQMFAEVQAELVAEGLLKLEESAPPKPKRYRVLERRTISHHGSMITLPVGTIIDPRSYGGEVGVARIRDDWKVPLELVEEG